MCGGRNVGNSTMAFQRESSTFQRKVQNKGLHRPELDEGARKSFTAATFWNLPGISVRLEGSSFSLTRICLLGVSK